MRYQPARHSSGAILQSALPKRPPALLPMEGRAFGLQLRGAVLHTYVYDTPDYYPLDYGLTPTAVACDVMVYGKTRFMGNVLLRVPVAQRHGLQEGEIWKPRPSRIDVSGQPINPNIGTNPVNLDGDHVLITFLDDDLAMPLITGQLAHPGADIGHGGDPIGTRMHFHDADGEPRFWKHHGAYWGVDSAGNMLLDLSRAHPGIYNADGTEPPPAGTGVSGNFTLRLPPGSKVTFAIDGGPTLVLEKKGSATTVTVGDGVVHPAIAEHLHTLYDALKARMDAFDTRYAAHQHLYAFGDTLPPTDPEGISAPGWDGSIQSSKMAIDDG